MVRSAAAHVIEPALSAPGVSQALRRRSADETRSVRLAAAWTLRASLDPLSPAARELQHFLDLNADQPGGQMRKGEYYFARNELEKALPHFQKAVAWDPYSPPFHQQLASALSALNRPQDAAAALREACGRIRTTPNRDSNSAWPATKQVISTRLAGNWKKPSNSTRATPRHRNLGLAQSASGQTDVAIASLLKAESAEPRDPRIPYARATILARLSQRKEAAAAAGRALEINPNYTEAKQLLEQLGQ